MKTLLNFVFILVITATSASFAEAGEPAWKRTCRISGGLFWALAPSSPEGAVLCRFDEAAIAAESLFLWETEGRATLALQAYLSSPEGRGCEQSGGEPRQNWDEEGRSFGLCAFPDGSYIELGTLEMGPEAARNEGLTRALRD